MAPSNEVGRNELCSCGSGKKFKKCCLDKEKNPLPREENFHQIKKEFLKGDRAAKYCSAPASFKCNCSPKVIKAHTVPKSSSLRAISRDGHVVGWKGSFGLVGVNQASIFSGFCKTHDNEIFSPIETEAFEKTSEQCFLWAYRAVCLELYRKREKEKEYQEVLKEIGKQASVKDEVKWSLGGVELGLKDMLCHKEIFDQILKEQLYTDCRSIVFELSEISPVVVCSGTNPNFDFCGNRLQDLLRFAPDLMTMNVFNQHEKGFIVLSWSKNYAEAPQKLIKSLYRKSREEFSIYLIQYLFFNCQNCFISPDWWDKVGKENRQSISEYLFLGGLLAALLEEEEESQALSTKELDIEFPEISKIHFINWSLEEGS